MTDKIIQEQDACYAAQQSGKSRDQIAKALGLSRDQVKRRLAGAKKRLRLDPELAARLAAIGITDLAGLHSGWLLEKDKEGSGEDRKSVV